MAAGLHYPMQLRDDSLLLSASDLIGHLNCRHLTGLDIEVARGTLPKPAFWDPLIQILWERGARHEREYVEHLKAQGFGVTVIDGVGVDDDAVAQTRTAMIEGHPIIVQGAFRLNGWVGRTDILRRIDTPSDQGAWSYEVIDTKLARETKGGTVLQLCLYAELVASVQGLTPAYSYVVAPWSEYEPQIFRMDEYAAYYRRAAIARALGMARSSVGLVLRRLGLNRLDRLQPRPPVIRYERQRPGEMIHLDIKAMGRDVFLPTSILARP